MTTVQAQGIYRRYARRFALLDVSFTVSPGEVVMLVGRNGSGKSTLLRVLATLLRPDRGALRVFGLEAREQADEVRRRTALLGHRTFLYEPLTALENLEVAARLLGRDDAPSALRDRLHEVGLAERAHDPASSFSAGMRQRLALARVLLKDAELVLLDEPYGHLDPPGFRLVDALLGKLRSRGRTVVMATHLLARGRELSDAALVLEAGRLVYAGPTRDLPAHALADVDPAGASSSGQTESAGAP